MVIAFEGFRDEEYLIPRKIFDEHKYIVDVASYQLGVAIGKYGTKVKVDLDYKQITLENYDCMVLVGGPGTVYYLNDQVLHKIIMEYYQQKKLIAAICMAPVILANAGLLEGRNSTVYIGNKEDLIISGAKYTGQSVEINENIITANGPDAAEEFGNKIVEYFNKVNSI